MAAAWKTGMRYPLEVFARDAGGLAGGQADVGADFGQ